MTLYIIIAMPTTAKAVSNPIKMYAAIFLILFMFFVFFDYFKFSFHFPEEVIQKVGFIVVEVLQPLAVDKPPAVFVSDDHGHGLAFL
jgi:hypothetical protein